MFMNFDLIFIIFDQFSNNQQLVYSILVYLVEINTHY